MNSQEQVLKTILSEDVDWKPFPAFPPSARLAVLVGQPSESGPYTIRVKVPHGVKLMPIGIRKFISVQPCARRRCIGC
jgi:hypothetical protein